MKTNQREYETFDILHQIVETSQALRVLAIVYVDERANFRCGKRDMLVAHHNLEFLTSDTIGRRPHLVVLFHYFRVFDYSLQLVHYTLVHVGFFANERIIFVIGIVGVTQLAIGTKFEFKKFVAKFAFVTDVVTQIEVFGHFL